MGKPLSRRQMFGFGASAVVAGTAAGVMHRTGDLGTAGPGRIPGRIPRRPARPPMPGLPAPRVLRSRDGELSVRLTAQRGVVDMNAPRLVQTYTFDRVVPGHTWEIRPGDTLRVTGPDL